MIDERELIAAIVAAPDDDAPRLVYADWLSDRGDPRGELIVVGCELARLARYDPRHHPLRRRERELATALRGALGLDRGLRDVRRGFPTTLTLAIEHVATLQGVLDTIPIARLEIHARDGWSLGRLLEHRALGSIRALKLRLGSALQPRSAYALAMWPALAQLDVLELDHVHGEDLTIGTIFESPHLRRLKELRLVHADSHHAPLRVLAGSALATSLQELTIIGYTVAPADLPRVGYLQQLRSLSLLACRPGDQWRALDTAWVRLEELFVSASGIDDGLGALLAGDSRLRQLGLAGAGVFDNASFARIASAPALRALRSLAIQHHALDDEAIATLVDGGRLATLDQLVIDTGLGDRAAERIADTPDARQLRELWLGHRIGAAGMRALVESPHLENLWRLELFRNRVAPEIADRVRARFGDRVSLEP